MSATSLVMILGGGMSWTNMNELEKAFKDKSIRILTFPNFAELVFIYQSEVYIKEYMEMFTWN